MYTAFVCIWRIIGVYIVPAEHKFKPLDEIIDCLYAIKVLYV